jgi:hypothetical protein
MSLGRHSTVTDTQREELWRRYRAGETVLGIASALGQGCGNLYRVKYTPQAPARELGNEEWVQVLQTSVENLQTAVRVNQRAIDAIRKELAKSTAAGSLVIKALVKNQGNTTGGIYDAALLTFDVGEPVQLTSERNIESLIVKAHEDVVVTFRVDRKQLASDIQWTNLVSKYQTTNANCRLRLRTLDNHTIASTVTPFYPQEKFRADVFRALAR